MRLDEHCIKRKVGLFGKPLSYSSGGYLLGYLTVRSLWLRAATRDTRLLNETDLALMYLRSFFFDMGLVARLLDPSTKEIKSAETILNHINQRFLTFYDIERSDIESYEQNVLKHEDEQWRLHDSSSYLRVDEELYSLGQRLRTELLNDFKSNRAETLDGVLKRAVSNYIFGQRDVMYVGSLPVKVNVDEGGHFHALREEVPILEGKAVDGAAAGTGEGSLDLFFSILPKHQFKVITITRGKDLVATKFLDPELAKNGVSRFNQFKGQHTFLREIRDELNQAVERVLKNSYMEIIVTHVRQQIPRLVEKIYLPIALDRVPDNKLETNSCPNVSKNSWIIWFRFKCLLEIKQLACIISIIIKHLSFVF